MVRISADLAGTPPPAPLGVGLLLDGLPINITAPAAAQYIAKCDVILSSLGDEDSLLALKLLTGQLVASAQTPGGADLAAVERIFALATRLGDELARAYSLAAWCVASQGPEHTDDRVEAARAILETAERVRDDSLEPFAFSVLLAGLLEQGDIRSLDMALVRYRHKESPNISSFGSHPADWFEVLRLILDGESELAEQHANKLLSAQPQNGSNLAELHATQIGMIRWMQGRIEGAEEHFLAARREHPEQLFWAASLAWLWLMQGRRESAEALLRTFPPPSEIAQDRYWLSTLTTLAEIARVSGTRESAEELCALLVPFEDRLVPVGEGITFWGTAARSLGLLEEHLGHLEEARRHLELAISVSSRIGALAWHCEAQIELAEFAIRHELSDIPAYELLAEARKTCEARGFAALERRAMHQPRILVLGRFEVISLCGTRADWTSRKARDLLKMLVSDRGVARSREQYMDVLWPGESPSSLGNRFSVAVSVVRRALDPQRLMPTQQYVVTEGDSIWLNVDQLTIDLERFVSLASRPDEASREAARAMYRGEAFSDEPYADWLELTRNYLARLRSELDDPSPAAQP